MVTTPSVAAPPSTVVGRLGSNGPADTVGRTGSLDGNQVQQAATPRARAGQSGIGTAISNFFSQTLPALFSSAKDKIMSLFRPSEATSPLKPISEFDYPGDYFVKDDAPVEKKYPAPPMDVGRAAVYATAKHFAAYTGRLLDEGSSSAGNARGAFLRGNTCATAKIAVAEGASLKEDVRAAVLEKFAGKGLIAFRDSSYDTAASNYEAIRGHSDHGIDADAAAREAVRTAEEFYAGIFGMPGDQASIDAAAAKVPQGLCDALAIALKAIDDAGVSDATLATDLKDRISADMIALRVVNPAITGAVAPRPGEAPIDNTTRNNLIEFSKFAQNIANGIAMGTKEPLHPAAADELRSRGTEANLQATYKAFVAAVVARADPGTVDAAVTSGTQMKSDFDAEQLSRGA